MPYTYVIIHQRRASTVWPARVVILTLRRSAWVLSMAVPNVV